MTVHFNSFEEFEGLGASEVWYERADGSRYKGDFVSTSAAQVAHEAKQGVYDTVQAVTPLVVSVPQAAKEAAVKLAAKQGATVATLMRAAPGRVPWLAIGGAVALGAVAVYALARPKRHGLAGLGDAKRPLKSHRTAIKRYRAAIKSEERQVRWHAKHGR